MEKPVYRKFVEQITRDEFANLMISQKPSTWFTDRELEAFSLPGHIRSLAGRYLIKKMICDFLGKKDCFNKIEILNNELGKPEISLGGDLLEEMEKHRIRKVECSLSHSRNYIAGMTIICY